MFTAMGLGHLSYYTRRRNNIHTTNGILDNLLTATIMSSSGWMTKLSVILYP